MTLVDLDNLAFPFQKTREMVKDEMFLKYGVTVDSESLDDIADYIYEALLDMNHHEEPADDYYS